MSPAGPVSLEWLEINGKEAVRVRADLVPLGNRPAHPSLIHFFIDVPPVLAVHEKRSLDAVGFQDVKNFVSVGVGTIIKRQGESSRHGASGND